MSTQSKQVIRDSRNTQHTPTPWEVSYRATINGDIQYRICGVTLDSLTKENAEFIVRAVNSHEELLDALRRSKRVVAESCGYNDGSRFHTELLNDIEAAIAKAEGK